MLDSKCSNDAQCYSFTNNTICLQVTPTTSFCKCKEGYQSLIQPDYIVCVQVPKRSSSILYPSSLASICILFILLAFLLCFVIKLFTKSRCQHRPSADAALTPVIKLDGKDLIVAESMEDLVSSSSPISESRTYSPGPVLTPDELRKMSLLSSLSVTIPLDQDFNVRAVSPTGCQLSPEHIIPQNQASPAVEHIEQSVTIIPNLRAVKKRRKSMADYAFPELHPEAQLQEPSKNLLIYTRTGVDSTGRRHSVSIPLLPLSSVSHLSIGNKSSKTDKPVVTIQRKGSQYSHHRRSSSKNMVSINESINESCGIFRGTPTPVSKENSMDCLTVPGIHVSQTKRARRMSPRQNSLPARTSRGPSPSSTTRSHGSFRSSFHRPARKDFYQFLDSAIAH